MDIRRVGLTDGWYRIPGERHVPYDYTTKRHYYAFVKNKQIVDIEIEEYYQSRVIYDDKVWYVDLAEQQWGEDLYEILEPPDEWADELIVAVV